MTLRVLHPEYGGSFATQSEGDAEKLSESIRFVLPGELVTTDGSLTILDPSPDRTTPRCRHFGVCGGCDYQHATDAAQLELKRLILKGVLGSSGIGVTSLVHVHAADPWQYRNRIRVRVDHVESEYHFGYNRRGTREFLPIVECPIASPLLLKAADALLEAGRKSTTVAAWLPSIAEIEFQTNGQVIQATVFTRDGRTNAFPAFCEALHDRLPELIGAGCLALTAGYGARERAAWGAAGLGFTVLGRNYWVTRGGFFQVNTSLLPEMVGLVTRGRTGALAWDLYAGVGLFSRVLAGSFARVVAVESAETASADLASAAKSKKKGVIEPVESTAADFLRRALLQRERPDLVVVDPPRAGLGAEVCALLGRAAAPAMVYVSCDPITLARDLAMLVHSGYRIEQVHLLDMFPQTFHLETVVFLQK